MIMGAKQSCWIFGKNDSQMCYGRNSSAVDLSREQEEDSTVFYPIILSLANKKYCITVR